MTSSAIIFVYDWVKCFQVNGLDSEVSIGV